ncbi:M23 family metallopeptidase [Paraliobacillus sp. X-1268]|uniref:M23 family metallopeptidase n=1 Tax=Paraliobacillus sp. X-1268 TaxID=2213193 RepID=UPI000E3EE224|nr:M23 family metallopeptidase [Paraliobacillus sp. X-1268]
MTNFIWPTDTKRVTSEFRTGSRPDHHGVDIAESGYHPIYASAKGKVTRSDGNGTYGQCIYIEHAINGQTWETVYAHMRDGSRRVSVGEQVNQGEIIGVMGNTGRSSGPHLHFELHKGNWNANKSNAVDPLDYLGIEEEKEELKIPTEEPSDDNYYRIMSGLFFNMESFENALKRLKEVYTRVVYIAPDKPILEEEEGWRIRFYTGQMQGHNNAQNFKKALESEFSWNFHIVDSKQDYENLVYRRGGESEEIYYRVQTGLFDNVAYYNNARDELKSKYGSVIYEASDDSKLREDEDLRLRFYTGRVMGISAAQALKSRLQQKFTWNFHIVEAVITKE